MTPEESQLLALKEIKNGMPQWNLRFERVKEVELSEHGWVCVVDTVYQGDGDLYRHHCLVRDNGNVACILDVEEMPDDIRALMRKARRARYLQARKLRTARRLNSEG